jgi:peroxiredoxin
MQKFILALLFVSINFYSYSQKVNIKGNALSYSGETIEIYTFSDYVVKNKTVIAKSLVDTKGNFNFNINTKQTIQIFIDLNVFKGIFFIEPGKNYEIILPQKTLKDEEDSQNPYFEQIEFYISQISSDKKELNNLIINFDTLYNKVYNNTVYYTKIKQTYDLEKMISKLEKQIPNSDNSFFNYYKKYKLITLRSIFYNTNPTKIINENFTNKPILYSNPAYNETIDIALSKLIIETINDSATFKNEKNDWLTLNKSVEKSAEIFADTKLREYLILKNLYTNFYSHKENQKNIIVLLYSCLAQSSIEIHKQIAENFINKAGNLIINEQVPNFNLKNKDNQNLSLKDFSGKFIYLSFSNKSSYSAQRDVEALKILNSKKIDRLEIVTIWVDKDFESMNNYTTEHNYEWTFLFCAENSELLSQYKIVSFPTYFIINPEGKLVMMPAPSPSEDFEPAFSQQYEIWNRNEMRKKKESKSFIPN